MQRIGIFGTSGMAREAGDIAWSLGLEPLYVARDEDELRTCNLPAEAIIPEQQVIQHLEIPYVIGIGDSRIRQAIAERFRDRLQFTNLIHPSATFGMAQREVIDHCKGVIIAAGVRFTSGIAVGDFCIFNQNATIAHDCVIGNHVHVGPGANVSGNVHLQDGCWIGAGAVINQGSQNQKLRIGANTIIGSGAVVIEDCATDAVYAGVPAKRIR